LLVNNVVRRGIFLFFCFQFFSHAMMLERGEEITYMKNKKVDNHVSFKKIIKNDMEISKIEEESIYDEVTQGLTKEQEIRRKQMLYEQKIKIQRFLLKLRRIREKKIEEMKMKHNLSRYIRNHKLKKHN